MERGPFVQKSYEQILIITLWRPTTIVIKTVNYFEKCIYLWY
jgi:hypothetical protein